jgi:peptide-O-fucosyltransferase
MTIRLLGYKYSYTISTLVIVLGLVMLNVNAHGSDGTFSFNPNGYVMFCLCMGRFGNQADHFLGSMTFAKRINRTLVVPPFRTYKNVPYDEWFKMEKLREFQSSVIRAEDFMTHIAPVHWPRGKRVGFCWLPTHMKQTTKECEMKVGNPTTNFWDELGVERFDGSVIFDFSFMDYDRWQWEFPSDKYPVIALKGPPALFPVLKEDRENQKYMIWSENVVSEVDAILIRAFKNEKFIGIHLRNGPDWEISCKHIEGNQQKNFMASPQCLDETSKSVNTQLCFPSKKTIIEDLRRVLFDKLNGTVANIYVATDKNPMINEIKSAFGSSLKKLKVHHEDPWLPIIDLAVLARAEWFIGNCVSSFTSFAKRERDINMQPSSFWAFDSL